MAWICTTIFYLHSLAYKKKKKKNKKKEREKKRMEVRGVREQKEGREVPYKSVDVS